MRSGILLIGVQINGTIRLNPDTNLTKNAVVFALAPDRTSLQFLESVQGNAWDVDFIAARRNAKMGVHATSTTAEARELMEWKGGVDAKPTNKGLAMVKAAAAAVSL